MSTSGGPNPTHNQQYQGKKAEGRRVRVFWEDDNKWMEGTVTKYSTTRDKYYVNYDSGATEYEEFEYLEFTENQAKATTSQPASSKQLRRSTRVTKRRSIGESESDDDYEEDEDEDEEPTRVRSTRGRKQSNGSSKAKDTDDSGSSSGSKPKKVYAKKNKIEEEEEFELEKDDGDEDEEEDAEDDDDDVVFIQPKKNTAKRAKKSDDSESEYEETKTRARKRVIVEDDDDDDDDDIVFNLPDDDEEEEENEEEEEGDDDDEESSEEESSEDEEFEDKKRKRGRAVEKPKPKKVAKKKAKRSRVVAPAKDTEGVQFILAARRISPSTTTTTTKSTTVKNADDAVVEEVDTTTTTTSNVEFLVKFRGRSYRDIEWVAGDALLEQYPSAKIRVRRAIATDPLPDERPNPDYLIVDRILDKQVSKGKNKTAKYYVKWRGLGYEDCTWEDEESLEDDVDMEKINAYNELEAAAMKRGTKPTKKTKWSKTMDPPAFLGGRQLKDFQKEGFLWLAFCWHNKKSSLLADEMGLGKTIQTISLLEYLRTAQGIPGPFLVIAPLSTIENWQREITDWTGMKALVLHGNKTCRDAIRKHEWKWPNGTYKFDALVTSYEIAIAESALIASTPWKVLVVDEAHRIKNQTSKLLSKLVTIKRDHCVMLTGTPLQNDIKELWSLLNFLDPNGFGEQDEFMENYGDLKDSEQVQKLHKQLGPFILRRLKEDVDTTIPVKEETVLEVELSTVQKTYYRAIMEKNREFLGRGMSSKSNQPKLNNIMMQIRKVCNHPFLIPGVEDRMASDKKLEIGALELLVSSCAKLVLVDKLLTKLREGGHKVLIFSQMVELLDILEEYMIAKDFPYERLDGGVKSVDRQAGIDRFNSKTEDSFVFLLSTRAGGVGINLTAADTVIIYDSDWNPQNDLQAQARCHRIGQTENVKVYRLLSRNTYEQYMFQVSAKKLALGHVVLLGKNGEYDGEADELDKKHVDKLLKYGAYDLFKEDLTEAVTKEKHLQEEDIDSILQRATTITYDNAQQPKDTLGGFNKATFVMGDNNNDVDLDDADFWSKVLPEYKSLEYFKERMHSGAAVASDESKAHFMDELSAYVNDRKENPPSGVLLPGDLLKLLLQIEYNGKFNHEQRTTAKNLRELLEGTRGRRAAAQQSRTLTKRHAKMVSVSADEEKDEAFEGGELSDENDEGSGSEEDEDRPNKRRRMGAGGPGAPAGPSWNKARRERLKWALLRFGFGRWETTAHAAKVSPEEAQVYTENCVCKLLKNTAPNSAVASHSAVLNEQYEKYMVITNDVAQKQLVVVPTHSFDSAISVDVVLVADGSQDPNHVYMPGDRLQFKLVTQGGSLNFENAVDLRLVGMYGPDLVRCYPVRKGVVHILAPGFIGQYVWKCVRPGPSPQRVLDCGQACTLNVGCHPMFEENFDAAPRAPWVKKLSALYILNQLAEEHGSTFASLNIPALPGPPLPQWGREHDKLLLTGVYKHGYGKYSEILSDEELGIGSAIDNWVESAPDLRQPSIPLLNKRLYKILEAAAKQKEQQGTRRPPAVDDVEDGEDFVVLTARIRFQNKELIIRMRDDDPFICLRKPVLKQLNVLGFCRGEGRLIFSYNGFQITAPQVTTPRKLNITGNFNLSLAWVVDKFAVEVVWLDKTVSRVYVKRSMRMTDILGVKYLEPFDSLRILLNGATIHPNTTIEDANVQDNGVLTIVRMVDKMRLAVQSPDRAIHHHKVSRTDPLSVFTDNYTRQMHMNPDQISFTVNGRKLDTKRTPEELGISEKDTIFATIETLLILVKNDVDTSVEKYTIAARTNLKYLMTKYIARQAEKGNTNKITFTYNGREVGDGTTAAALNMPNGAAIQASWDKDQTVIVSLRDFATTTNEEYRVGVDVVLRDLVDAFCADNHLSKHPLLPPRVTYQGRQVELSDTMKALGVQDRDVVHVVRDPSALANLKSSTPSSSSHPTLPPLKSQIYTIDD